MRRLGIGLAALMALLTSACAAGQYAQTAGVNPTLDGTTAKIGDIKLAGVAIEAPTSPFYASGTDADLRIVLVNSGTKADRLTSITSSTFSGWGAASGPATGRQSSVPLPAGSRVGYGTPEAKGAALQLLHAKASLYPGTNVTLTFTFANAGTLKLVVPVALQAESSEAVVPGPSATGQEG